MGPYKACWGKDSPLFINRCTAAILNTLAWPWPPTPLLVGYQPALSSGCVEAAVLYTKVVHILRTRRVSVGGLRAFSALGVG